MGSNWRENVLMLWGADWPVEMVARVSAGVWTGYWIAHALPGELPGIFQWLTPASLPMFVDFWVPVLGHPNFPYGLTVDPD